MKIIRIISFKHTCFSLHTQMMSFMLRSIKQSEISRCFNRVSLLVGLIVIIHARGAGEEECLISMETVIILSTFRAAEICVTCIHSCLCIDSVWNLNKLCMTHIKLINRPLITVWAYLKIILLFDNQFQCNITPSPYHDPGPWQDFLNNTILGSWKCIIIHFICTAP